MPLLDETLKAFISRIRLCYVATVCPDGTANLSPKGSIAVWDARHVTFVDIASPQTIRNLRSNPSIEINVLDPFSRRGYRLKGRGSVKESGPEFDAATRELKARFGDRYPVNGVVVVEVETVRPLLSPVYQFNPDADEAEVRREWMAFYGVQPVNARN